MTVKVLDQEKLDPIVMAPIIETPQHVSSFSL